MTGSHIIGGLHPELTLDWYCEMLGGLKQRFPEVHLKAFTMVEVAYLAQQEQAVDPGDTRGVFDGCGRGFTAGRRRRRINSDRVRRIICDHQDRRQPVAGKWHRARTSSD